MMFEIPESEIIAEVERIAKTLVYLEGLPFQDPPSDKAEHVRVQLREMEFKRAMEMIREGVVAALTTKRDMLFAAAPDLLTYAEAEEATDEEVSYCDECFENDGDMCVTHAEKKIELRNMRQAAIAKAKGGK